MVALLFSRVLVLVVYYAELCQGLQLSMKYPIADSEFCTQQSKNPYFDIDIVVGRPWRIYYTWNVFLGDKCLDMTAQNSTRLIMNRIYNDMHNYLETQPEWDAATLYVTIGTANHELLLFADQGAAGRFLGVPNVIKDGNITPIRNTVPLLKFFFKLIDEGRYLLMIDCQISVASLMSRQRHPDMLEVANIARSLELGVGEHACISDRKNNDRFLQ